MRKPLRFIIPGILALAVALTSVLFLNRVSPGNVGVVYASGGVEEQTLSQGWHWLSPTKKVKQFPISQQQIVFSDDPADYNAKEHPDWHIDAPANGGMVGINLTVNYNFMPDRVVELYTRFNGMDGEAIVESRVQNSIIAYVKEVTPQFTVMDIYSDRKSEVNQAITKYLNEKLGNEYGINVSGALIIDVELDATLQEKIRAKEQAKQDAEIAELNRQTALAQAETEKAMAEAKAEIDMVTAQYEAEVKRIEAQAEADANRTIAASITPELIEMKEAEARMVHGWITVQGAETVVTRPSE